MSADLLATWWMVFLRAGGLLVLFPVFSAPVISHRVRLSLAVMVAFLLTPAVPMVTVENLRLPDLIFVMMKETVVGLFLGFMCRLLFFALETAGSIIQTEIGLSLPPSFNPLTSSQSTIPGVILNYLATLIWLCLDLHHWLLVGLHRTFSLVPTGTARVSEPLIRSMMTSMGWLFMSAMQIAAPVLALSFIMSMAFAVMGRAVPQMNVFASSFGIRILAGLMVFMAAMQVMGLHIIRHLQRLPDDLLRLARLLGG